MTRALFSLATALMCLGIGARASTLEIESFGPTQPFAIGSETVTLVGTVRNTGKETLPAGAAGLRIYALAGLDYTEGDTAPRLPELQPDQVASFRWKLAPTGENGSLVCALAIEQPGSAPIVRVATIPRLAAAPAAESPAVSPVAAARCGRTESIVENNKVRARIFRTQAGMPLLILSCRTTGGWRVAGASVPLAEVLASEGGQKPWWEVFKLEEQSANTKPDIATLRLSGVVGLRWRATIELAVRPNSAVIDARLQLSPLRPMRIAGLRLCPFYVGAGSFGAASAETLPPEPSGPNVVTAVRWGEITTGTLRPGAPLFPGWELIPGPPVREAGFQLLAAETRSREEAVPLDPGGLIEWKVRLFALTPSQSVRDAVRITFPPTAPSKSTDK